jgi:hypothetical protein
MVRGRAGAARRPAASLHRALRPGHVGAAKPWQRDRCRLSRHAGHCLAAHPAAPAAPRPAGVPTDYVDGFPKLTELRRKVANTPAIKAFYDKETHEMRKTFKLAA